MHINQSLLNQLPAHDDKHSASYLQVKDWGSGEPADLGSLQVESFSPDLFSDHDKPFYEQLARRLEELQVKLCILHS